MSRGRRRESVLGGKEQRGLEAAGGEEAPDIRERPRDISPAWRRSELCGYQSNGSHTASQQPWGMTSLQKEVSKVRSQGQWFPASPRIPCPKRHLT